MSESMSKNGHGNEHIQSCGASLEPKCYLFKEKKFGNLMSDGSEEKPVTQAERRSKDITSLHECNEAR